MKLGNLPMPEGIWLRSIISPATAKPGSFALFWQPTGIGFVSTYESGGSETPSKSVTAPELGSFHTLSEQAFRSRNLLINVPRGTSRIPVAAASPKLIS
jgi:hypothetical protein